jgi:hypothetical protein
VFCVVSGNKGTVWYDQAFGGSGHAEVTKIRYELRRGDVFYPDALPALTPSRPHALTPYMHHFLRTTFLHNLSTRGLPWHGVQYRRLKNTRDMDKKSCLAVEALPASSDANGVSPIACCTKRPRMFVNHRFLGEDCRNSVPLLGGCLAVKVLYAKPP